MLLTSARQTCTAAAFAVAGGRAEAGAGARGKHCAHAEGVCSVFHGELKTGQPNAVCAVVRAQPG